MSTEPERIRRTDLHGWFNAFGPSDACSVLGPDHPLTRSTELVHTLAVQAIATAAIAALGAIAAADRQPWAAILLAVAVFVELIVLAILALSCELRRERVLGVIASHPELLPLAEVGREKRRLMNVGHRSALADRLGRALDQARSWHQISVASRPPEGVKLLSAFACEVEEVAELVRTPVPNVRGVAVLELFFDRRLRLGALRRRQRGAAAAAVAHALSPEPQPGPKARRASSAASIGHRAVSGCVAVRLTRRLATGSPRTPRRGRSQRSRRCVACRRDGRAARGRASLSRSATRYPASPHR